MIFSLFLVMVFCCVKEGRREGERVGEIERERERRGVKRGKRNGIEREKEGKQLW